MEELQARLAALEAENVKLRTQQALPTHNSDASPMVSGDATFSVCRVAVKLPPFWSDRVAVWFAQAEAQFLLAGVTTDETKYSHILSRIDHQIAGEIEDIVAKPPETDKYKTLKEILIKRFSSSEEQRLRKLLSDEELGDRKPSQFLRHLKSLAGAKLSDDSILRQLWLRRLPHHVQGILAAQSDLDLDRIADIADKIVEAQPAAANVCVATTTPSLSTMMDRIEELSRQVAALSSAHSDRSRVRDRSTSSSRQLSRSATPRGSKRCWYHTRFGAKASKCTSPCDWKSENPPSNQ